MKPPGAASDFLMRKRQVLAGDRDHSLTTATYYVTIITGRTDEGRFEFVRFVKQSSAAGGLRC